MADPKAVIYGRQLDTATIDGWHERRPEISAGHPTKHPHRAQRNLRKNSGAVMNQIATIPQQGRSLTAVDIRAQVNLVQDVMKAVMRQDVHYGIIPGCKQPSLFKAGSEVLLTTFRIAVSVEVEDLSTDDCIRYRVRTIGTHQGSGVVVGEGIGECSSNEGKYKWRRCYVKQEFDATPENRRRIKYAEAKGRVYENMEVRTDPADLANTVLKMAKKRAQIDLTLTATAASDIFTQDVEDLPEEIRERAEHSDGHQARPEPSPYPAADFESNLPKWRALILDGKTTADQVIAKIESKAALTEAQREQIRTGRPPDAPLEGEVMPREEAA